MSEDSMIIVAVSNSANDAEDIDSVIAIHQINEISINEYNEYKNYINYIIKWSDFRKVFDAFVMNCDELLRYLKNAREEIKEIGLTPEYDESKHLTSNINRLILNILTMGRTFSDHGLNNIQKAFGKDSQEHNAFSVVLKTSFDTNFYYRFMCKLRNFCQHCGMPCLKYNSFSNLENPEFNLSIQFDTKELLENYDSWGPVKKDLESMDMFSLESFIENSMDIIDNIMGQVDRIFKVKLDEAFNFILNITKCPNGPSEGCKYAFLVDVNKKDEGNVKFSLKWIHFDYYEIYKANLYPEFLEET